MLLDALCTDSCFLFYSVLFTHAHVMFLKIRIVTKVYPLSCINVRLLSFSECDNVISFFCHLVTAVSHAVVLPALDPADIPILKLLF